MYIFKLTEYVNKYIFKITDYINIYILIYI